jgi:hypothetical protein
MPDVQRPGRRPVAVAGSRRRITQTTPPKVSAESDQAKGSDWRTRLPSSVGDWLQVIGFLGAVVYFAFLYLYQQFYNPLDLAPEDVGLDRTAILVRALGALLLLVPIVMGAMVITLVQISVNWVANTLWHFYFELLAKKSGTTAEEVKKHLPSPYVKIDQWLSKARLRNRYTAYLFGLIWIPTLVPTKPAPYRSEIAGRKLLWVAAQTFLISTVILFAAAIPLVHNAAAKAARGETVQPVRFGGLTLLDIKSLPCTVEWIGSGHPPAALNEGVHYLGRSGTVVYLRTADKTIAVPANAVIVSII